MTYRITVAPSALENLKGIRDRRVREKILERIDSLANEPEKQGRALIGELGGYRSVRAVGQRYRILYRVAQQDVLVLVAAIGLRKEGSKKDVYTLAKKLFRLRLLDGPDD